MPYIGVAPNPRQNREVDDISSSFNGSTTAFTLQVNSENVSPGSNTAIIVSLGGVLQNPGTDYTIAASTITFTTAPASGLSFFGVVLAQSVDIETTADGTVTNAKVNASAAIAGTKINPDFGSQAISTTNDSVTIGDSIIHSGDTNTKIRFPAADTFTAETAGSERLRLTSNGRLSLGNATNNASPGALLQVKADDGEAADLYVGQFTNLEATAGQSYGVAIQAGSNSTDHGLRIKNRANDATHFLVRGDGNVAIGTSTIADDADHCKLVISGQSGTASGILIFQDTSNNEDGMIFADDGSLVISADRANATGGSTLQFRVDGSSEKFRIDSDGRGFFNRTSALAGNSAMFQVNGGISIDNNTNYRNIYMSLGHLYFYNGTNQGYLSSAGAWTDASDENLKKDITSLSYGIDSLKNLKPRKFKMKSDDKEQIGFIAQEVESVIPEVVDKGNLPDGTEQKGLAYGHLTAVLTAALQEAITKIETLETKVAALEAA